MKLRVKFSKHGALRFIGHLDVMRFFQKAIRRAQIDVTYTGGFSPHQVMSFAHPLGVGLESDGEYMDIEVNTMTTCADIRDRLNAASVPEIRVLSVVVLPDGAPNAMASVAAAEYVVTFREGRAPRTDLSEAARELLAREEVLIMKEGKAGPRQVDIRPGIYELEMPEPGKLHMLVDASSAGVTSLGARNAGNVKPIQVVEAMLDLYGETLMENALRITRLEIYGRDGSGALQPLEAFGSPALPEDTP